MRIALIGNCQVQSLSVAARLMLDDVVLKTFDYSEAYSRDEENRKRFAAKLDDVDYVFAQTALLSYTSKKDLRPVLGDRLVILLVAALLATDLAMNGKSVMARILALPPLHYLGVISYSLYLWHLPTRMMAMRLWPWQQGEAGLLHSMAWPLSLALIGSSLSFFLMEMPARHAIKKLAIPSGRRTPALLPPVLRG